MTRIGSILSSSLVRLVLAVIAAIVSVATGQPVFIAGVLTLQEFTQARRNYFTYIPAQTDAAAYKLAYEYFGWLSQMGGSPDLQVVPFTYLTGSNTIIADAACKIYVILLKKATTTAAWFKLSDSATTSSSTAGEFTQKQEAVQVDQHFFPKGFAMASGVTVSSDTTAAGNTGSTAGDGAAGVIVLGRP